MAWQIDSKCLLPEQNACLCALYHDSCQLMLVSPVACSAVSEDRASTDTSKPVGDNDDDVPVAGTTSAP